MRAANAALTALLNGQRKGLQFNGSTQYVSVPIATPLLFNSGSVECWVQPLSLPTTEATLVADYNGAVGETGGWLFELGADGSLNTRGNGIWTFGTVSGLVSVGKRTHVAFVADSAGLASIYVNGQFIVSSVNSAKFQLQNLFVARASHASVLFANAIIDEVRVYARVLSAQEIADHYLGTYKNESGLVLWLPFDEGTGTIAFDLSGKGNNGTLVNAPAYVDFNPYPGSERQFRVADLLTITLVNGITLRLTSADIDITSGGNVFSSKGPQFTRGKTKTVVGIQVDQMDLSIFPAQTDLISGQPFMQAVNQGIFDGATVTVERAFMPAWGNTAAGTLVMFSGRMGPADSTRTEAKFKVNSDLELLNIQMPRNIYQPGCMHTVYDSGCVLSKANFAVRGAITSGSTQSTVNASAVATASGIFDLGTIEFEAAASLPGSNANYVSTPDSVGNSVTGDIDIRCKVALTDWTPATPQALVGKYNLTTNNISYYLDVDITGVLRFVWAPTGNPASQIVVSSTTAPTIADGAALWVRATLKVNNGAGGNDVNFYTSPDGVVWTQLGATVTTAGATSLFDGIEPLAIGASQAGAQNPALGRFYYAELRNGINGPIVAKFDPTVDTPQGGGILSSTGELWSMNGTAALVGMTNRGVRRTVKSYTPGVFNLITPLPSLPVAGDLFAAYPGCDKQQATCGKNVGITYTADSTTDTLTATAHGLLQDQALKLSTTGTFPAASPALNAVTQYFVINPTANTFQLSRTIGGPAIDLTSNGTGTNKVAQAGKFANLVNFRGTPLIPVPETMI